MTGIWVLFGILLIAGILWRALRKGRRGDGFDRTSSADPLSGGSCGSGESTETFRGSEYASDCGSADSDSVGGCDSGGSAGD